MGTQERGLRHLSSSIEHQQSAFGARQAGYGNPPKARPLPAVIDQEHARKVVSPTSRHDLDYLTPGELAAALKVSKRTLSRAETEGRLEGWVSEGVGTRRRYRRRTPADQKRSA